MDQNAKLRREKLFLERSKIILWVKNDLDGSKIIWTGSKFYLSSLVSFSESSTLVASLDWSSPESVQIN